MPREVKPPKTLKLDLSPTKRKISISDVYASQSPIFCYAVLSWWNKEMREKRKSDLQAAFYQFYLFLLTLRLLNSAHLGDAYGNSPLWLRVCWGLLVFLAASLNLFKYSDVQCTQVYNSLINFASHNCIIFLFILLMCLFRLVFFSFSSINYGIILILPLLLSACVSLYTTCICWLF